MAHYFKFWDTKMHETKREITVPTIINWVLFWLFWILAFWSLCCMVWSNPGYVPHDYNFDHTKMSEPDQIIYNILHAEMHATANQLKDETTVRGSIRRSYMSNTPGFGPQPYVP